MTKLDAMDVATLLTELGRRVTLAGGNPYRARAYLRAADPGGLSIAEIEAQHDAIDILAGYGDDFRIFKGIESDILSDGSLDYPDEILRSFDFIIASVHSQFRKDRDLQTESLYNHSRAHDGTPASPQARI